MSKEQSVNKWKQRREYLQWTLPPVWEHKMGCGNFKVEFGVWVVIMTDENPRAESEMQRFLTSDSNAAFSDFSPWSPAYCIVDVSQQSLVAEMANPCSIRCCNLKIKWEKRIGMRMDWPVYVRFWHGHKLDLGRWAKLPFRCYGYIG